MPLRPEDVVRKNFTAARFRGGYLTEEVDTFLEEVVSDLRRREAEHDELLAKLQRPESTHEIETDRVIREREQLDLIRTERQELVSDLGALTSRLTSAKEQIATAEQRSAAAQQAQAEAETCRDEASAEAEELERQVARSQAVHDDLRGAYDAMVAELRGLRTESESQALELLGEEPAEPTGNPVDDIAVIRTLARRLHTDYVSAGEERGRQLREAAQHETDAQRAAAQQETDDQRETTRLEIAELLASTNAQNEQTLAEAMAEHERLLGDGATKRETLLSKAQQEHDQMLLAAETQSTRIIEDAQGERDAVIADLTRRRAGLEGKIAELESTQREYRQRLRSLISEQLAAVDTDQWEPVGPASPQPVRTA